MSLTKKNTRFCEVFWCENRATPQGLWCIQHRKKLRYRTVLVEQKIYHLDRKWRGRHVVPKKILEKRELLKSELHLCRTGRTI